jgi:hypothetical protein
MLRKALVLAILASVSAQAGEIGHSPEAGTDRQHHEWARKFIPAPEREDVVSTGSTEIRASEVCERGGGIFHRLPFDSWQLRSC